MHRSDLTPGVVRAFNDEAAAERAGMWFGAALLNDSGARNWCRSHAPAHYKALAEGTDTSGGYLVPTELADAVWALLPLVGVFYSNANVRKMNRDVLRVAKRRSGVTLSFAGENTPGTESTPTFGSINLGAQKAMGFWKISDELFEDAVGLGEFIALDFAFAVGDLMDRVGFNGTGISTDGGIFGVCTRVIDGNHTASVLTAAAGHDLFTEIDATDLSNLMALLPEGQWQNASWYCSGYAAATMFCRLGATAGGTIRSINGPRPLLNYLGFPINATGKMAAGSGSQTGKVMALFGDLSMAATVGERRVMTVQILRERFAEEGNVGAKLAPRFDINVHDLGDNSTAGPIVALVGA